MRYFAFLDANHFVRSTYRHQFLLPGDWGPRGDEQPADCVEIDDAAGRMLLTAAGVDPATTQDRAAAASGILETQGGWSFVNGGWVRPPERRPTITRAQLFLLFPKARRTQIRTFRRETPDEDLEDFYDLLGHLTEPLDLNDQTVSQLMGEGLALHVARGLLSEEEANRIAQGRPPV